MVSLPLQIVLYYVIFTCENCFDPVAKIIYHLNRIVRHPRIFQLHHVLQQFLLQLLNQRFAFTAMHFMNVDFTSLRDVGGFYFQFPNIL